MISFKEYLEEAAPTKAAQFHGADGTSVNVYSRGDKHFAEIVNKNGSNVSASSVFPKGSNADAQSKLDQVVLRSKKKDHKGALDILNTHSHIKFQHVTNEESLEEAKDQHARVIARLEKLNKSINQYAHRWNENPSQRMQGWVDEYNELKQKHKDGAWKAYCDKNKLTTSHNAYDCLA